MADSNRSTRLRNACDSCHKLKRRCGGSIPCENCTLLGSSCSYSVAGRLGRPRGSKSRRRLDSIEPPRTQSPGPVLVQDSDAASAAFDNMLYLNFDSFDPASPYNWSMNQNQSPDAALNLFSTSEADALQNLDHLLISDSSGLSKSTIDNNNPSMQVQFQQEQQQQQHQYQQGHPFRQQPEPQLPTHSYPQHQQLQPLPQTPPRCQCIRGLSSLLHDLKHAENDEMPLAGLDKVLLRVSDALAQWSALVACVCCQNKNDNAETLLLAALAMRRVAAQLREVDCEFGEPESEDVDPQIHVGAFKVIGSDRVMLLGVLQTVTVRKLGAAVRTIQSMLQTKQAQPEKTDVATLRYIKSILDESAKTNK